MTLTKERIIERIWKDTDQKKAEIQRTFESLVEIMKQTLASGEDIMISGFGKFCVREKKARRGRNPQTGEAMDLDGRKVVTFKCSGKLREKLNS
ncbi:putative integration host factor subunit alpha [delta proteobacterium NaphS2]|nr:putative integration host factor subunit alpha [delta proteobacterium NaphS2]